MTNKLKKALRDLKRLKAERDALLKERAAMDIRRPQLNSLLADNEIGQIDAHRRIEQALATEDL